MDPGKLHIEPIINSYRRDNDQRLVVCWIKKSVVLEVNNQFYTDVSDSVFFFDTNQDWKILNNHDKPAGYLLYIPNSVMNNSLLKHLSINTIRLFQHDEIPMVKLSPGIEKRTLALLEMIDELLSSKMRHKDNAIISLIHAFFVYCDCQCNIKSSIQCHQAKNNLVFNYKRLVDELVTSNHDVAFYADRLHVSPNYLNEAVQEVLSRSAKSIIIEQLIMRSRWALKFSDQTIKEISHSLGFSSSDYFSSFYKNHTGLTPTGQRKAQIGIV